MRVFLILAAILALTFSAAAQDCTPTTTPAELSTPSCALGASPCVYFDLALCELCGTIWIYEEANGLPGLQRSDEVIDDTCGGQIAPDTLIF